MSTRSQPNILWFLTDDTGFGMLGYHNGSVLTPFIDSIAANGVVATRFHCSAPACGPSRFSYLSGVHPGHCTAPRFRQGNPIDQACNIGFNVDIMPETPNMARHFKEHGYHTGFVGKCHTGVPRTTFHGHSYDADDDPRDPAVAEKLQQDYDAMRSFIRDSGFDYAEGVNWGNTDERPLKALHYHNMEWQTQAALDFIDENTAQDKPFMLHMATSTMHGPEHVESINDGALVTEHGLLDKPISNVQAPRDSIAPRLADAGLPTHHRTAGMLWTDDAFAAVWQKIVDCGEADNTIIVFSTDHGIGTANAKFSCYQGGVHIPFCMRWDGHIQAGSTSDALLQNVDLYPSLCSAVDIPQPAHLHDGRDCWAQLNGAADERTDLYFEWGDTRAVRTRRWKYIAWRQTPDQLEQLKNGTLEKALNMQGKPGGDYSMHLHPEFWDHDQLYDLDHDPAERINLWNSPHLKEVQADMVVRLRRHLDSFEHPFPDSEDGFIKSDAYWQLAANTMSDNRLFNNYFYRQKAF